MQPESEPESVRPSDARMRRLADLRAGNAETVKGLQRDGVGVQMGGLRLEVLIDSIFAPEERIEFELRYEEAAEADLAEVRRQVVRAKLTQGINGSPNGKRG